MATEISLKEAERKVFKATFQDGLWDIFIACFVMQFAIAPLLSSKLGDFWSSVIFLPFWALMFAVIWLVRKTVVTPRLGSVQFGRARKIRLTRFTLVMLIINCIALIAGLIFAQRFDLALGLLYMVIFGFLVLLLSSIAAYYLECRRFFIYGCLFVFALITGEWLFAHYRLAHHGFPITFGIVSGFIFLTGIFLFIRLLRNNPLPAIEPSPEGQQNDR